MVFKVVIIDDNPHITQSLSKSFDWKAHGCVVAGIAGDGEKGKKLIKDTQPDIIVSDIRMPNLDGFEMLERAKSRNSNSKVIIITGYQEFQNAQKALKLGAFDILLKPIDDDVLSDVISSAIKSLKLDLAVKEKITKITSEKEHIKYQLEKSLPRLRSEFLHELLNGGGSDEEYRGRRMRELGISGNRFILFLAYFSSMAEMDLSAVKGKIDELGKEDPRIYISTLTEQGIVTIELYNSADSDNRESRRMEYVARLSRLLSPNYSKDNIITTTSQIYSKLSYIPRAFHEAAFAMQKKFFSKNHAGLKRPISALDASGKSTASILRGINVLSDLLSEGDKERRLLELEKFSEQVGNCCRGDINIARVYFSELCFTLYRRTKGNNRFEDADDGLLDEIITRIQKAGNAREILALIVTYLNSLKENDRSHEGFSHLTEKILEYIQDSITCDVSLKAVAGRFKITPPYLSRLLKKETGITFTGWITKLRIDLAKQILRDPLVKVNEAGERVGFQDYAYFYHVFRKIEGISPREYKKRLSKKN